MPTPICPPATESPATTAAGPGRKPVRRNAKPSCEGCYFGSRGLCALGLGEPCSTYRPNSPEGLVPPTQPMLLIRDAPATAGADLVGAA